MLRDGWGRMRGGSLAGQICAREGRLRRARPLQRQGNTDGGGGSSPRLLGMPFLLLGAPPLLWPICFRIWSWGVPG
ncbi:hypothetical protein E2562_020524 [Oryza meyeriana var. granulata]|uniref:Uncharacterized protein n=1 Tax=Oryza meyeriana var. granulata TaxID=110450 RepID=A0A6G1E9X3_9ORYZ|nr:hypothetical protein E2562_020524 [Oryza meyeriana var. granulata]